MHGVRFGLGLQDTDLSLRFGLFNVACFLGFGLQFGDSDFLELDFLLRAQALVLLLFQEEAFEALGIFSRKLNVTEKDFTNYDSVARQSGLDRVGGFGTQFFALDGKDLAGFVARTKLAIGRRNHRADHLLVHRLRQILVNAAELGGIQAIADGYG